MAVIEFLQETLAKLNNDKGLSSDVIVETIKQEFERNLDELYQKRNSCEYKYNLCDKEYKLWQESGFSLNYEFDNYHTLLRIAAKNGYKNIIKTLTKSGVGIDGDLKYYTPLHQAVNDGHREMVKFLLENGANVNVKPEAGGCTPLHFAVKKACAASEQGNDADYKKYVEIIEFLIANKANVNAKNEHGSTPLGYAVGCYGSIDIATLLITNGADVNVQNEHGYTPLHDAAEDGQIDIAKLLIDNGADVNIRNGRGDTPLHKAYDENMVNLLIEKGVEIDAKNNSGLTALHSAACSCYNEPKILTLIKHGADPWAKTNKGYTPIDYYMREYERSSQPPEPGYLMKLKQAYNKDLIVRYSTLLIGAIAAITLFATGRVESNALNIAGAAAIVTVAAFAAGRVTYEVFKPSTKIEEIEQECILQEDKAK